TFSVAGSITLTSGELGICKNLTIQGPAASELAISGNSAARAFYVCESVTATLDGMTIRAGRAESGGGIYNSFSGTLTVTNSTISGNSADGWGGGIRNDG